MKKVALLTIFMLVISLASFAQVDVTVEGNSELTWGIALDDPIASGFTNSNWSKISFSLGSGSVEKGGEGDVSGYISIGDYGINYNTDDAAWDISAGDVTAKIMFSMGYVSITGTTNGFTFLNPVQDDDADPDNADVGLNTTLTNSGGFILGLDLAPATVEVGVFSEADWTANTEHAYGGSVKVTVAVDPLTIEAGVVMGVNYVSADPVGLGGKVSGTISIATIYVATDVELVEGSDAAMEIGGGVSLALADGFTLAVDASYANTADDTDIKVVLTEDGAGGFVAGLGISLTFELYNMLETAVVDDADDAAEWALSVSLDYTTDTMKPYATIRYGTFTVADDAYTYVADTQEPFGLNAGVELYLISDVTFTIDYNSDDLTSDAASNGILKLITKIAY